MDVDMLSQLLSQLLAFHGKVSISIQGQIGVLVDKWAF
jgi:hypothetical protein